MKSRSCWMLAGSLLCMACNGSDRSSSGVELPEDGRYGFASRFEPDTDSVSQSGQIFRHLLIVEVEEYIEDLAEGIETGEATPAPGDVFAALDSLYAFDSDLLGSRAIGFSTTPAALQETFDDVSSSKNLKDKFAGNDTVTDHADWHTELLGWKGQTSAEGLLYDLFQQLDDAAVARVNGAAPWGQAVPFYVTAEGLHLEELIVKWLLMGVTYSQGTDDYLDDATEGKGLLSPNTRDEDSAHTVLEHAWDEGFGYFGAARDYAAYTDAEIAEQGLRDTDDDGSIDLVREVCFGASVNAAKRDVGAVVATDFTADAFEALLEGRALIAAAGAQLDDDELGRLRVLRNTAVSAWEGAIAATAVHYINELLVDTAAYGTDGENIENVAKHFSELKGFSLGLQLNPRSHLSGADFVAFHKAIGTGPVLPGGEVEPYRDALRRARAILGDAYDFAPENLGHEDGTGGW